MWGKAVVIAFGWLMAASLVLSIFHHLVRRNRDRREQEDRRHGDRRKTDRRKHEP